MAAARAATPRKTKGADKNKQGMLLLLQQLSRRRRIAGCLQGLPQSFRYCHTTLFNSIKRLWHATSLISAPGSAAPTMRRHALSSHTSALFTHLEVEQDLGVQPAHVHGVLRARTHARAHMSRCAEHGPAPKLQHAAPNCSPLVARHLLARHMR